MAALRNVGSDSVWKFEPHSKIVHIDRSHIAFLCLSLCSYVSIPHQVRDKLWFKRTLRQWCFKLSHYRLS